MTMKTQLNWGVRAGAVATLATSLILAGCGKKEEAGGGSKPSGKAVSVQNIGSDTMVNLAQAWAEAYHAVDPGVSVEVSGWWQAGRGFGRRLRGRDGSHPRVFNAGAEHARQGQGRRKLVPSRLPFRTSSILSFGM